MRLTLVTLILALAGGCGWFAGSGSTDPAYTPDPAVQEDGPTCRPAGADTRGPAPLQMGERLGDGWIVTAVDASHREFARFTFTKGDETTAIELRFFDGEAGDWNTPRTQLMPAPDEEPPQALLEAIMAHLRAFDEAHAGDAPFLSRTEGVEDPYEGLPPCTE